MTVSNYKSQINKIYPGINTWLNTRNQSHKSGVFRLKIPDGKANFEY